MTTGGVSVGDHDLVRKVLSEGGLTVDFWQIAMRPGKPLMFGRMGDTPMMGLPGNPVSSMVCALLFLGPAIDRMLGRRGGGVPLVPARLGADVGANNLREDYMRAALDDGADGAAGGDAAAGAGFLDDGGARCRRLPDPAPARRAGREARATWSRWCRSPPFPAREQTSSCSVN